MMDSSIVKSINLLTSYIIKENFRGYDPYDTLNSKLPFSSMGKLVPLYAIQLQKRNPFNIRFFIGIKKDYNPKALGLLLKSFTKLFRVSKQDYYLDKCNFLFRKLIELRVDGYSGDCWGYNFDWASSGNFLPKNTPSVVVTAFVINGIYEFYKVTESDKARDMILSSCDYILNDLPVIKKDYGICFAYTHLSHSCCYNASLLAAETLAKAYTLTEDLKYSKKAREAVNFVLHYQKENGCWYYSIDLKTGKERKQIDFHQGYVLNSLYNYIKFTRDKDPIIINAIKRGLRFYKGKQFIGARSLWRYPKEYPIEIHNQSQGIITFSLLKEFDNSYLQFAENIAYWTINNMQNSNGYFYYRKYKLYKNKISYMRWSNAWMLLALTTLLEEKNKSE